MPSDYANRTWTRPSGAASLVVMEALVHDPSAPSALRRTELPDPVPGPGEALIAVAAAAFNFLDLAYADAMHGVGGVPGEDAAGVVVEAAADGSGPPAGTPGAPLALGGGLGRPRAGPPPPPRRVPPR